MTNKKIWAATLFSTLLLTMTISSPVNSRVANINNGRQKSDYITIE